MATEHFLGRRTTFNYAVEDVEYGTKNTASNYSWPGYTQKLTLQEAQTLFELNPMDDTDANEVGEYYPMVPKFGGTHETFLQHMRFAYLGLGTDTKAGSSPYTHTLAMTNTLPSFSIQSGYHHGSVNFGKEAVGCTIGKIDWNFPKGDFVRQVSDLTIQDITKVTSFKAYQASIDSMKKYTASTMRPYKSSDLTLTLDGVDISAFITQARIGVNRNLQVDEAMDNSVGELISQPIPQVPTWDMGITLKMSNSSHWDDFKPGITLAGDTSFLLSRSSDSILWTMSGVKIESAPSPIDIGGGLVIQELSLKATSCAIVETNTIATDYDTVET